MISFKPSNIGKIIKSDSHVNYKCRVYGKLESNEEISETDYSFGQFVKLKAFEGIEVIGVIYDSQLYNPDYGNFGPRLSNPASQNQVFMPDFIEETAVILDILLLGWIENSVPKQEIPPWVIPLNTEVTTITMEEVEKFHTTANNELQLQYYTQIQTNTGNVSFQLINNIINTLLDNSKKLDRKKLELLKQHIKWQQTMLATKV